MEDLDPSLEGGFRVIHDREVPIEVRLTELHDMPQDIGSLEAIRVKILVKGGHFNTEVVQVCWSIKVASLQYWYVTRSC